MRTRNLVASVILILFCTGYAYLTANLATRAIENTTQPSFFPWVIAVCLFSLSLALFIQSNIKSFKPPTPRKLDVPFIRSILALGLSVIYLILLPRLGFIVANIMLFMGLMYLYGERQIIKLSVLSFAVSIIIFYIFREIFQIRLPSGILMGIIS